MSVKTEYKQSFVTKFYNSLVHETLLPLLIMMTTPHVTLLLPYLIVYKNSDFRLFFSRETLRTVLNEAWNSVDWYKINFLFSILLLVFKPALKKLIESIKKKFDSDIFRPTK